jgi:hypothetical protein
MWLAQNENISAGTKTDCNSTTPDRLWPELIDFSLTTLFRYRSLQLHLATEPKCYFLPPDHKSWGKVWHSRWSSQMLGRLCPYGPRSQGHPKEPLLKGCLTSWLDTMYRKSWVTCSISQRPVLTWLAQRQSTK